MNFFRKMRAPIFFEVSNSAGLKLEQLQSINASHLPADIRKKLEDDIKKTILGINGEQNVAYELQNSRMPMYALQDLHLSDGQSSAQVDFIVITRKCIFVIECKNLYGNIQINNNGDFIRKVDWKDKKEEGMRSPIRQNQIHLDVIKELMFYKKRGLFTSEASFERAFHNMFRPVVVIANDRTVIDDRYAPAETKELVTRSDRLVAYIKQVNEQVDAPESSDKQLEAMAQFFYDAHTVRNVDYAERYRSQMIPEDKKTCPKCGKEMVMRVSSKTGDDYLGCTGYNETEAGCRHIEKACPKCEKEMVMKASHAGVDFLGCTGYKRDGGCKHTISVGKK